MSMLTTGCRRFPRCVSRRVVLLLTAVLIGLPSCTLLELQEQADEVNENVVIFGKLEPSGWGGEPIVLVLSREGAAGGRYVVDYRLLHDPGSFYFYTEPGNYKLAAFEDRSGDLRYRDGDPVLIGGESILASEAQLRIEADLKGAFSTEETLPERFDISPDSETTERSAAYGNLGRVIAMDAPEMSLELGQAGLWKPAEYREQLEIGLFFLEPYDPGKIPVLFVHGIGGAPIQFETLANRLDRERFQPWLFAYPSIFPLSMLADVLNLSMDIVCRKYDFDEVHVVAHSMGGLVSRAYLNEYSWSRHDYEVNLFVTIASPLGGQSSAAMYPSDDKGAAGPIAEWIAGVEATEKGGVQHVAFTDMSPQSEFMKTLYAKPLPDSVTYHMVFAFLADAKMGPPNDGTVSLASQLRPEAQEEALSVRGYPLGHTAILSADESVAHVLGILGGDRAQAGSD